MCDNCRVKEFRTPPGSGRFVALIIDQVTGEPLWLGTCDTTDNLPGMLRAGADVVEQGLFAEKTRQEHDKLAAGIRNANSADIMKAIFDVPQEGK